MSRIDRSRVPAVGADPDFRFPSIVAHRLKNGLQVRTVEHRQMPIVTFVLQVDGGIGADPSDLEGLAAMTADMVDEGTGGLSAIDVSDAMSRIGGEYDVDPGADTTAFTLTTLTRFAQRGADLLAAITTEPNLLEADFTRVRQLRLDRLVQIKDLPPAVAERAFLKLLYNGHPYGHLALGNDAALRRMQLEDVARFHAATFAPSRSTLVVAGAMTHDELLRVAEEAFARWEAPLDVATPVVAADIVPPLAAPVRFAIVPRDGAAQSELRIGHLSARRDTPDYPALLVMNAVLGGQFVSRINLKLREEKGYTYGARTGFDWRRGLAPFVLQASVHTAATVDAIHDSLNELDGLRGERPPTANEMSLAKASLTRGYPRGFETVQQVARSVAALALYRLPDTYFEEFVPKVHAVDAGAVTAAAHAYLDPARLTTLVVGDYGALAPAIAASDLGSPQILPIEA